MKVDLGPEPAERTLTITLSVAEAQRLYDHLKLVGKDASVRGPGDTPIEVLQQALFAALAKAKSPLGRFL